MIAQRSFAGRRKGRFAARPAARFTQISGSLKSVTWLLGIAWSPALALWATVGYGDGVDAYILTSPQGTGPWTERANPKNNILSAVVWTGAQFASVGQFDGIDAYTVTSPDGVVWTERANVLGQLYGLATEGGGKLLATGQPQFGTAMFSSSDDHGVTWARVGTGKDVDLRWMVWTGQQYVAVGWPDGADAYIVTTPDRVTFTERANPLNVALEGVGYGDGRLVAVGNATGAGAYIITSDDHGATWQGPWPNPGNTLRGVVWTGQQFVACGNQSDRGSILTSRDGRTWTQLPWAGAKGYLTMCERNPGGEIVLTGGHAGGGVVPTQILSTRGIQ